MISLAVILLAISEWAARRVPAWVPCEFVTSVACGVFGLFLPRVEALFILSGVFFGVTFASLALSVVRSGPPDAGATVSP